MIHLHLPRYRNHHSTPPIQVGDEYAMHCARVLYRAARKTGTADIEARMAIYWLIRWGKS